MNYYDIDDFCIEYEKYCTKQLLLDKRSVVPATSMSLSKIMTIVVFLHLSNYRTFKKYYTDYICVRLKKCFPVLLILILKILYTKEIKYGDERMAKVYEISKEEAEEIKAYRKAVEPKTGESFFLVMPLIYQLV